MRTAVVILNWNGSDLLKKFLPSVCRYSTNQADVYVADNASTDNSIEIIRENFPEVKIIKLQKNYGFAEGYNKALKQIEAEYFCLLNSDVEVSSNWIEPIIDYMNEHKEVAICQPKLLSKLQEDFFEYAGAAGGFIDKFGYPFCRGRLFNTLEKDEGQYDNISEIFWATGACMFVRSKIFNELGGLDSDFFAHMEEIDFCWRAKNANYKVVCVPNSTVYHLGGATLPKSSSKKTYLNFRNNLIMLYKNLPENRLFSVFLTRWLGDIIAAVRFLFDSGPNDFVAVFKAHRDFLKTLKITKEKRKKINPTKTTCLYNACLVFDYFFKHKNKFSQLRPENFIK